jgi:xanthine dehydrogenase small subunit
MAPCTRFILNDREVETGAAAGLLVLDFLREHERLTGTKEGCKEGDCGACAVLIGELEGDAVRYQPVTSCLAPLAEVHGKHVVTIEGCNLAGLNPVQEAVVEFGGTQCGFCTPGIVVSLHGLLLDSGKGLTLDDVKYALSGHLCRCTGYRSLKDCAATLERDLGSRLQADGGAGRVPALVAAGALPEYFAAIPARLRALHATRTVTAPPAAAVPASLEPADTGVSLAPGPELFIAGGTDLYVQQGETIPERLVEVLGVRRGLKGIRRAGGEFRVGSLTTFEEFGTHPAVIEAIPAIASFNHLVASWQIRNRATLAGNIANASPIGDFTALLLALDARVELEGGGTHRTVSLKEFFRGYKQIDLRPGELLTEVAFADPSAARVNFEKVSKRTCLDIASVNSACSIRTNGGTIDDAHFSLGGVAPTPLYLHETSLALRGRPLDLETAWQAVHTSQREIAPISDVRGSATYKRLLARQLIIAHFVTLFPDRFAAEAFFAREGA